MARRRAPRRVSTTCERAMVSYNEFVMRRETHAKVVAVLGGELLVGGDEGVDDDKGEVRVRFGERYGRCLQLGHKLDVQEVERLREDGGRLVHSS